MITRKLFSLLRDAPPDKAATLLADVETSWNIIKSKKSTSPEALAAVLAGNRTLARSMLAPDRVEMLDSILSEAKTALVQNKNPVFKAIAHHIQ